jgi:hypothetical protein
VTREQKRFAQLVRKLVRQYVDREREAPGFSLWVSDGADPRAASRVRIGAAVDEGDVRARAVGAVHDARSHYAAVGRLLHSEGGLAPTALFGLVVFARGGLPVAWVVDIVAGRTGAWQSWELRADVVVRLAFVQAALERVAKWEGEGDAS